MENREYYEYLYKKEIYVCKINHSFNTPFHEFIFKKDIEYEIEVRKAYEESSILYLFFVEGDHSMGVSIRFLQNGFITNEQELREYYINKLLI